MIYDVIIIGSGPAGLTAGIYTSRASLKTLIIAGTIWGGQLMQTSTVENFPAFPEGIQGSELMLRMRKQAEHFGSVVVEKDAVEITVKKKPFTVSVGSEKFHSRSLIIATGADTLWLNVPGEKKLIGRGVSSCAPCDAFFYKDKDAVVVGGGDSAMEEALVLTKFAKHITIVHRRDSFRASKIMQERVLTHKKITVVWNSEVVEILGDKKVEGVKIKDRLKGTIKK
ncbi:MAG: FAD-dependent oxidoreductase, partial [Candidatus Paceibacterota bacterium]